MFEAERGFVPRNAQTVRESLDCRQHDPQRAGRRIRGILEETAEQIELPVEQREPGKGQQSQSVATGSQGPEVISHHSQCELIDAADQRPVRVRLDLAGLPVNQGAGCNGDQNHHQRQQPGATQHPQQRRKNGVVMEFDDDRPTAVWKRRQVQTFSQQAGIVPQVLASDELACADDCDHQQQQRQQPHDPIPQEQPVINPASLQQLGEQVAAQRHEQCHACMAFVQQGEWRQQGHVIERDRIAVERMQEVPGEHDQGRESAYVVKGNEVGAGGGFHSTRWTRDRGTAILAN